MINTDYDIRTLPNVPLEKVVDLPDKRGVYFAVDTKGVILYIGRANRLRERWKNHAKYPQLQAIGCVTIYYFLIADGDILKGMETKLIRRYTPKLNSTIPDYTQSLPPTKTNIRNTPTGTLNKFWHSTWVPESYSK